MQIAALCLMGVGILVMVAGGAVALKQRYTIKKRRIAERREASPSPERTFVTGFIVGQVFFNMGIMFYLGYITAYLNYIATLLK